MCRNGVGWDGTVRDEADRSRDYFERRPQRNRVFLRGLQLAINVFGTGGAALLKDVRKRITGFSRAPGCGWQRGPALELTI